jgi:hypothetical protein
MDYTASGKHDDPHKIGKTLGITSERLGGTRLVFSNHLFIPRSCSLMPNLFFPWNTFNPAGEQTCFRFVHTIKKKIL